MERFRPTHLHAGADPSVRTLLEIVAAIDLVAGGGARRVVLSSLPHPELVAAEALAHAQGAGVPFRLDRGPDGGDAWVVIGPMNQ